MTETSPPSATAAATCVAPAAASHAFPRPLVADTELPSSGGIMRPLLPKILSDKTLAPGTKVRLGVIVDALVDVPGGVAVAFSDGARAVYDLVIGADGVFSRVRTLLFPHAPQPRYTGQCVCRLVVENSLEIGRREQRRAPIEEQTHLVEESLRVLAQPI